VSIEGIKKEGLITRAVDWVFGYDFFISYSHGDGPKLPLRLKERLALAGFRVFLDQSEYVAGLDLRGETRRQVSKSRKLVVVARAGALRSQWVKREVDVALAQGKIPVIVNVNGAVEAAQDSALATAALDKHWLRLNTTLDDPDGELSDAIVGELVRGFNHTRQEIKRQRIFAAAAAVLAVTAGIAIWQAIEATRARIVAETQRDRAQRVLDQVIATSNRRVHAATKRLHNESVVEPAASSTEPPLERTNALIARGSMLLESEDLKPARAALELAHDVLTSRPEAIATDHSWRLALLKTYDRLAVTRLRGGDPEAALALINRGLGLTDNGPRDPSPAAEWPRVVATLRQDLGELLLAQRQFDDAEKQVRLALDLRRNIARDAGDLQAPQRELAIAHARLGDLLLARPNAQAALQSYQSALSIIEPIASRDQADSELQRDLSFVYQRMADALLADHNYEAAVAWVDKDVAISERLARNSREPRLQRDLASSYDRRARTLELLDRNTQALEEYGKGILLLEAVISKDETPPSWQRDAAAMLESTGKLLAKTGQPRRAVPVLRRALAIREGLAASFEEASWQQEVEASYRRASEMMLGMGQPNEARETAEQYLLAVSLAADSDSARAERTGRALGTLCWSALNAKSFPRAIWACTNAVNLAPKLSWIRLNYAHALMLSGDREAARAIYVSGLTLGPKEADAWKSSILKDFDTLRRRGIEDGLMVEVASRLGS
jgi:tetratricopeptide (TPR) repeat protein